MGEGVKREAAAVAGFGAEGLEGSICMKAARVWTPGCSGEDSGGAEEVGCSVTREGVREGVGARVGLGCTTLLSSPRSLLKASFASMSCSLARAAAAAAEGCGGDLAVPLRGGAGAGEDAWAFGATGASGALLGATGLGLIPFVVAAVAGGGVCSFSFFGGGLGGGGGSITTGLFFFVSLRGNIGWLLSILPGHSEGYLLPFPQPLGHLKPVFLDLSSFSLRRNLSKHAW